MRAKILAPANERKHPEIFCFQIQIRLNGLAEEYSESVVRSCFSNVQAITAMTRKQKFLKDDPGEDVAMPQTKAVKKPVMSFLRRAYLALRRIVEKASFDAGF
jgi:hypothetical protein